MNIIPPTPHSGAQIWVSVSYSVCHSQPAALHAPQSVFELHTLLLTGQSWVSEPSKHDTSATWQPFMHVLIDHLQSALAFEVQASQL